MSNTIYALNEEEIKIISAGIMIPDRVKVPKVLADSLGTAASLVILAGFPAFFKTENYHRKALIGFAAGVLAFIVAPWCSGKANSLEENRLNSLKEKNK